MRKEYVWVSYVATLLFTFKNECGMLKDLNSDCQQEQACGAARLTK